MTEMTHKYKDLPTDKRFNPDDRLPERSEEDASVSIDVGVIVEGDHFPAYFNYDDGYWWVEIGGNSIGYHKIDDYDISEWYYLEEDEE